MTEETKETLETKLKENIQNACERLTAPILKYFTREEPVKKDLSLMMSEVSGLATRRIEIIHYTGFFRSRPNCDKLTCIIVGKNNKRWVVFESEFPKDFLETQINGLFKKFFNLKYDKLLDDFISRYPFPGEANDNDNILEIYNCFAKLPEINYKLNYNECIICYDICALYMTCCKKNLCRVCFEKFAKHQTCPNCRHGRKRKWLRAFDESDDSDEYDDSDDETVNP